MASLDYLSSRVLIQNNYNHTAPAQPTRTEKLTAKFRELTQEIDQIDFLVDPDQIATDKLNKAKVKVRLALAEFHAQRDTTDFHLLYSVATFADKLKKRHFENHTIWNSLDVNQKALLDKLTPFYLAPTEDNSLTFKPDSTLLASDKPYDFGDRAFIAVTQFKTGRIIWFDLRNQPGAKLGKPCEPVASEVELIDELEGKIVTENLGRLGEIFNLGIWKTCFISSDHFYDLGSLKSEKKAQLQEMYRFYWQSIVETLGLPVAKPIAVSSEGEWLVKSKEQFTTPLSEVSTKDLSPATIKKLAEDIHSHLIVELKHNINILGLLDSVDIFGVTEAGRCVVDVLKPLPAFFGMNYERLLQRHQNFLTQLGKIPALQMAVQELYTKSMKEVSEYKTYIQVLSEFKGSVDKPRDILRAYLLANAQDVDTFVSNPTEEEIELYTQNYLDFLKSRSKAAPDDENFREQVVNGHQELEKKLHNRYLFYICQRLPDTDDWQVLLSSVQTEAEALFQRLSAQMKQKLVPLRSDGWKSIEEQLKMQITAQFMENLVQSLKAFVEKIGNDQFTSEKLALFGAQSEKIRSLQDRSLNKDLMSFLHDLMQKNAKEGFVSSLKNHLKT